MLEVQKSISQTCDMYSHRRMMAVFYFPFSVVCHIRISKGGVGGGGLPKVVYLTLRAKFDLSS